LKHFKNDTIRALAVPCNRRRDDLQAKAEAVRDLRSGGSLTHKDSKSLGGTSTGRDLTILDVERRVGVSACRRVGGYRVERVLALTRI
jgi:hypothetical protein